MLIARTTPLPACSHPPCKQPRHYSLLCTPQPPVPWPRGGGRGGEKKLWCPPSPPPERVRERERAALRLRSLPPLPPLQSPERSARAMRRPLHHPGGGGRRRHRRGPTQRATTEEHSRAWAAAPGVDVSGLAPAGPSRTIGTTPPCRPPVSLMERQQHSSSSINTGRPDQPHPQPPQGGGWACSGGHTHTRTPGPEHARAQSSVAATPTAQSTVLPSTTNFARRFNTALRSHCAHWGGTSEPRVTGPVSSAFAASGSSPWQADRARSGLQSPRVASPVC